MRRWRTWFIPCLVLALAAAACSSDGSGSSESVAASGAGRSGTVIDALEAAGIPVLAQPSGGDGSRQVRLWEWQVDTMTRQYEAGNGWVGAELDDAVGSIAGAPISYFVAAWVSTFDTANAAAARDLMGEQDWRNAPSIVFPSIVLTLFVDDAVSASVPSDDENAGGVVDGTTVALAAARTAIVQESGGLCSAVMDFVHDGLQMVFDALQIDSDVPILSFFTDLLDAVIDLVGDLLTELVEVLTAPVAAAISAALGVIHLVTMIADIIQPWSVDVEPSEFVTAFSITGAPNNQQRFTATVADPLQVAIEIDWPDDVVDCAEVFGVDLPSFGDGYEGTELRWFMRWGDDPVLGSATEVQQSFDAAGEARLDWVTGHEASAEGDEQVGVVVATVVPTITVVDELETYAAALVLGLLPSGTPSEIRGLITDLYDSITEPLWESLVELLQPRATTDVRVIHHDQPEDEATDEFGAGEWVVIGVVADLEQEQDARRAEQTLDFTATVLRFVVADDGVRGDALVGRHFSLFLGQGDDLIGTQENRLRVRAPLQPMTLEGDAGALRASGTIDYTEYLNSSEGSLDAIGGVTFNSEAMGFGTGIAFTTPTQATAGVSCGRAGTIVADQAAWVGLRADIGSLDATFAAVQAMSEGQEPEVVLNAAIAELAALFADDCVRTSARSAAEGVGRLLRQGLG